MQSEAFARREVLTRARGLLSHSLRRARSLA